MPDTSKMLGNESQPRGSSTGWIADAIQSRRTVKTWLRACVAVIVVLVLMVDKKTSKAEGQVAFFSVIVALMLPPTLALPIFLMVVLTLFFGIFFGWAWGSAATAAGFAARSSTLLAQQQRKLQSSLVPGQPIGPQTQSQIFHGLFLDPRTSAVYGAFLFTGNFALGAIRACVPSLALLSIFGSIVLSVVCTIGPLLPIAQYTTAKLFIIPTCYYVAVAIACLILIFPESLSHIWLSSLQQDFWIHILDLLRMQSEALNSLPSDREAWRNITSRANGARDKLTQGTQALSKQIALINLDISIGRLGPTELRQMNARLNSIMVRAVGLNSFQNVVNEANVTDEEEEKTAKLSFRGEATPKFVNRFQTFRRNIRERETQHGHDLDSLAPIITSSSVDLRNACESGVTCVMDWFQDCNTRRWAAYFSRPDTGKIKERHDQLVDRLNKLQVALENFRSVHRSKVVQPYERFFDPMTKRLLKGVQDEMAMFSSRSLFICFVFLDTLDAFAEQLLQVLKMVVDIDTARPQAKIWFPGRLNKVADNIQEAEYKDAGSYSMGTATDPTSFDSPSDRNSPDSIQEDGDDVDEKDLSEPPRNRNPDAFPPTTVFGRFFVKLLAVFRFLKSPEGIFAFRLGIVSVALWIPAVCHSTAWLYYDNKGIWALIMAQTGLAVYAGDQIAGFILRIVGIILGLLFGLAIWYIGAGRGNGNPYGIVIATAVFLSLCLFAQIAGPPTQKPVWSMISTTVVFVVGYSWINANQAVFANPGIGVGLGWKRALLVMIGFTAAFIVMMFPNPVSSRVLVRKSLAAATREIGNIFAGEVEAFLAEEARARRGFYERVEFVGHDKIDSDAKISPKERRVRKIAKRIITVGTRLQGLTPSLSTAKYEPQLSGTWPHAQYRALFDIQMRIIGALVLLITSFAKLDTKWCSILVHRTPFLNPNFLSDIFSTLSVLSDSLLTGRPLPACLPRLRDRLLYHEYKGQHLPMNQPNKQNVYESDSSEVDGSAAEELDYSAGKVDGSSIGVEELTLDVLTDEQLPVHCTALVALSSIISRIDQITDIVRTLCGEASFRGYENLQMDYLDRKEKAHGTVHGL